MRRTRLALAAALAVVMAACGGSDALVDSPPTAGPPEITGSVTVLGAASLTDAFGALASAFEADHEGVDVQLSFDGSSKLATAIIGGAPADLFASADEASMDRVGEADRLSGEPSIFATNALQIVVPEGNPLAIQSLEDLASTDLALSLCAAEVPCGRYAAEAFARAGLATPPAGDQDSVKGVLTQVQLGEADAGIVYVTDVLAAVGVEGIDLPSDVQVEAVYPAAVLATASNPTAAAALLAFLAGDEAQAILGRFGFGPP